QEMRERSFPTLRKKGPSAAPAGLKVGDRVKIEGFRSQGILTKVDGALNRAEVMMGDRRVKASLSDIVKVSGEEEKRELDRSETFALPKMDTEEVPSVVNIIGLTVDEALPVVDKFIDQALVHGLEKVQIIHGMGSGRLRNAISAYLREHPRVTHHALGDPMKRGGGVTFVELS
ncbi:MAG: Smr/MutS family protein, partial [Deltaproteobacteria bacterium]